MTRPSLQTFRARIGTVCLLAARAAVDYLAALKSLWTSRTALERSAVIGAGVLLLIAFLPTLQFNYLPQDQWRAFRYYGSPTEDVPNYLRFYLRTGRPLLWLGEIVEHLFVKTIADLRLLRPIALAVYAAAGLALTLALWRACGILPVAAAVSLLFLYVPGVSFMYFQGVTAVPVTLCLVLSAVSYAVLAGPAALPVQPRRFGWRDLLGCVAFLAGLLTYPAWAMIVVPLSLLGFVFRGHSSTRDRLVEFVRMQILYLITVVLYFALIKLLIAANLFRTRDMNLAHYDVAIAPVDLLVHKIYMTMHIPAHLAIIPILGLGTGAGVWLLAYLAGAAGMRFANETRCGPWTKSLKLVLGSSAALLASLVFLLASVGPWLVSGWLDYATRQIIPACFLLLAAALIAVWKLAARFSEKAAFALLVLVCLRATFAQNQLSTCETVTSSLEVAEIRKGVGQWLAMGGTEKCRNIVVVRPSAIRPQFMEELPFSGDAYGENNVFASSCNPEHILQMVLAVLREVHGHRSGLPSITDCRFDRDLARRALAEGKLVLQLTETGEYAPSENTLVINLSVLGPRLISPRPLEFAPDPHDSANETVDKHPN